MDKSKIWVIGPSSNTLKYKDFIVNELRDKNTFCLGHAYYELVTNWQFVPKYLSWSDPHQLIHIFSNYDKIKDSLTKSHIIVPDIFTKICKGSELNHPSINQKIRNSFLAFIKEVCSTETHNFTKINCTTLEEIKNNADLFNKIIFDAEYRFNYYDKVLLATKPIEKPERKKYENILTRFILPILSHLKFKKVFFFGFGGTQSRFYDQTAINSKFCPGTTKKKYFFKSLEFAGKFINSELWNSDDWKKAHGMEIFTFEKNENLLSKGFKFIDPKESLK